MLLHRRLLRGTTALSSSTPSLLRLSSARDQRRAATTFTSQDPLFRARPVLSVIYMHTIVVWLPVLPPVHPLCATRVEPTQLSRRPLLQTERGGFVARRVPTEVRGTGRALPWGLLLHPVHPAPDALCSPPSADRRSCGGARRACSEERQQRTAPQAVRVAPVLRARRSPVHGLLAPYTPPRTGRVALTGGAGAHG